MSRHGEYFDLCSLCIDSLTRDYAECLSIQLSPICLNTKSFLKP